MKILLPGSTIGILGGGQLGRMLALEARRMGYRIVVLDQSPDAPCRQVADELIVARYDDVDAVLSLGARADVITYEFENIDARGVEALEARSLPVYPGSRVLKITQNRLAEKEFVRAIGVPVTGFARVETAADLADAAIRIGFPALLKTVYGGYDGKGQLAANNFAEAETAFNTLTRRPLIWEKRIEFTQELGIICARDQHGHVVTYPATENIHVHNILDTSIAPARIDAQVAARADEIARTIAVNLDIIGAFCVEMFLLADGTLLVNEIAPRPHNSGHYTIDACVTSQFEQQLRAICGLPLGAPRLLASAVMINILGESEASQLDGLAEALGEGDVRFHLYGKKRAKARRKMGHLTVIAHDVEQALATARRAHARLNWR